MYQYKLYKLELPVKIETLYRMNMEGSIYAFGYMLIYDTVTQVSKVVFKILPTKFYKSTLWSSQYMVVEDMVDFNTPMKIFICRPIYCDVVQQTTTCAICTEFLYQDGKCWNSDCVKFSPINIESLLLQGSESMFTLNEIHQVISTVTNEKPELVVCFQCKRCQRCKPDKKCHLHVICTHRISQKTQYNYHNLNQSAIRSSITRAIDTVKFQT